MDQSDTPRVGDREVPRPATEKWFNRLMKPLVSLGLGRPDMVLLTVVGRRSGKAFSVPVNVMEHDGCEYIISPRGAVQWVKNVRAAPGFDLTRGKTTRTVTATEVPASERAPLLKVYLGRYGKATGQYFPLDAGANLDAFAEIAERYPTFRLD